MKVETIVKELHMWSVHVDHGLQHHSQIESLHVGSSGPTHFLVVLGLAGSSKFQYSVPLIGE